MLLILIAGILKLYNVDAFAGDLAEWAIVPSEFKQPLSIAVPTLELAVAGAWMLRLAPRAMLLCALALVTAATTAYLVEWSANKPQWCSCFGPLVRSEGGGWLVARNIGCIALLTAGWISSREGKDELRNA